MTTVLERPTGQKTTWRIDESHSVVEFSVKHMVVATVKGRFSKVSGGIETVDETLEPAKLHAEIEAGTIDTGSEQRDAHLKSQDFLDVENYPLITFDSTHIHELVDGSFDVSGNLTIRGVTKEVVLHATDNGRGKTPFGTYIAAFSATTSFNRHDFGAKWNVALEAGGFLVGDTVQVSLEIEAVKDEAPA